jgi:hypothetical protein
VDSIPHREFVSIFHRMTAYIDLKGCRTPEDIERRIKRCYKLMENGANRAKKKSTRIKWFGRMKLMRILMESGTRIKTALTSKRKSELGLPNRRTSFPDAVIEEAIRHPYGIVNYSLRYGNKEARKKRLEHSRRRLGILTIHRRGIHSQKR